LPGSVATSLPPLSYATLHRKQMHPPFYPSCIGIAHSPLHERVLSMGQRARKKVPGFWTITG